MNAPNGPRKPGDDASARARRTALVVAAVAVAVYVGVIVSRALA